MIVPDEFVAALVARGIRFASGVPDSTLAGAIAAFDAHPHIDHLIATTEAEALALAAGAQFATGRPALTYLQNSGLGDVIDLLTSFLCPEVYHLPVLLLIGWRGEPGLEDEPQHRMMGRLTPDLLTLADVQVEVLEAVRWREQVDTCWDALSRGVSAAMLVRKGFFAAASRSQPQPAAGPTREEAIAALMAALPSRCAVVAGVGEISRELFELRERRSEGHERDIYCVGAMGSALSLAHGIALARPTARVVAIEGDGAALMGFGCLATVGARKPPNLLHVILDNGVHGSTGGQPTASATVRFRAVASACGYGWTGEAEDHLAIASGVTAALACGSTALLVVRVRPGARGDLGRPRLDFRRHREAFRDELLKEAI